MWIEAVLLSVGLAAHPHGGEAPVEEEALSEWTAPAPRGEAPAHQARRRAPAHSHSHSHSHSDDEASAPRAADTCDHPAHPAASESRRAEAGCDCDAEASAAPMPEPEQAGWARAGARRWRFSAEVGGTFQDGLSVRVGWGRDRRWAWGAGIAGLGQLHLDGADGFEGHWGRDDDGLNRVIRRSYFGWGARYFGHQRGGFFLGIDAGASEVLLQYSDGTGPQTRYWAATVVPRMGLQWFPFRGSFFFSPWVGWAATYAFHGPVQLGAVTLPPFSGSPRAGLSLGLSL